MPSVSVPNSNAAASEETIDLPLFDISNETPELGKAVVEAAAKWGFLWIAGSPAPENGNHQNGNHQNGNHQNGNHQNGNHQNGNHQNGNHQNGNHQNSNHQNGNGTVTRAYDLDEATVDHVFDISRQFFKEASTEEKQACAIKHNRGYVGMHVENLDPSKHSRGDFKQAFNLSGPDPKTDEWRQPLPATFQKEDATLRDFHARCRNIATRVFRLLAMGLAIPDVDWIARTHDNAPNTSRFLYYPTLPSETDYDAQADIRAGAHSDYGSITLLFTRPGQPGLEILKPNGDWASVPVFPPNYHSKTFPPIVVNIGDLLSYWTNGLLRSTIHRVILTTPSGEQNSSNGHTNTGIGSDRFSIAIFAQPHEDIKLTPMPSPLVADKAASFQKEVIGHGGGTLNAEGMKTLTSGDYLSARLQATYGSVFQREKK